MSDQIKMSEWKEHFQDQIEETEKITKLYLCN